MGIISSESNAPGHAESLPGVSHDVRNALKGVVGLSGLLLETELSDVQRAYAMAIRTSGETLLALVETLVDLCRMELGTTEPDPSRLPIVAGESEPKNVGQPGRGHVLVVDDNIVNQKVAVRTLEKMGYTVDAVANGAEAVDAVALAHYDAVVMDCHMPEMDGYEATRQIRRLEVVGDTPIIAITAGACPEDEVRCRKAGMNDYLAKPLRRAELELALQRWASNGDARATPAGQGERHRRALSSVHPLATEGRASIDDHELDDEETA